MPQQHPLKNSWTLMFQPAITKELIVEHKSYDAAQRATMKIIGELKTIEEAASTFNSIPRLSSLAKNDSIFVSREGKDPKYEAFSPNARKLVVDASTDDASRNVLDTLLIAILGENLTRAINNNTTTTTTSGAAAPTEGEGAASSSSSSSTFVENPCHVLRMAHKPSQKTPNMVRFEVWMEPCTKQADVVGYFNEVLAGYGCEESALQQ